MSLTEKLHRAIQVEEVEMVKELVKEGAELDRVHGLRGTALCAAIESRNPEIVCFLLASECDVNIRDCDGEPTLLLALRKDIPGQIMGRKPCLDIVNLLIDHPKTNLDLIDPLTRKSAIHFAAEQGMTDVVQRLLGSGRCNINATDANGNTALHLALYQGLHEVVRELVMNPECFIKVYNRAGLTPLHIVSGTGDIKSMNILIQRLRTNSDTEQLMLAEPAFQSELSLNINACSYFEKEACLHIAARHGYLEVVHILLGNGASVNVIDNIGNTPLILSIVSERQWMTRDNDMVKLILKHGANPNTRSAVRNRYVARGVEVTPLLLAVMNYNLDLVKTLVQNGADVNLCDGQGRSPLYMAFCQACVEIADFLLKECKEINVNMKTIEGCTCLHAIFKCGFKPDVEKLKQLVIALLEKGAQLHCDDTGKSPVDYAFDYENAAILHILLDATEIDADHRFVSDTVMDGKLIKGVSWIARAVDEGLEDIVRVFLYHGADIDDRSNNKESLLYTALHVEEYSIAKFLVENGCDLSLESYLKAKSQDTSVMGHKSNPDSDDSGSDLDDSSDYDSDSADLFQGERQLQTWMNEQTKQPRSLCLSSLVVVRKYFLNNKIPFRDIDRLPLPVKLRNLLRYKQ